jgi:hypothetical protein
VTVVAYDGLYVASDRLITNDTGMHSTCRKMHVFEDQVLVTTGAADHGEALIIWFKDGKNPAAFPKESGGNKDASLYVFKNGCPVMCFQLWPAPIIFTMSEFAAGCGTEIARTAMHLGRDAREAARITCELNVYCGGGIDYVDLSELEITGKAEVRSYTG